MSLKHITHIPPADFLKAETREGYTVSEKMKAVWAVQLDMVQKLVEVCQKHNLHIYAVINKKLITAGKIFKMTLSNKVRFVKYMSGTNAEILEYIVAPDSLITRNTLKDIDFPTNAIIGGIIRGNDYFIAVGDTRIEAYDRVAVFALPSAVKEVDRLFR